MRTLFIVHYPVFGGPHNQALRLEKPLRDRGWETIVLIPDEPGNAEKRLTDGGVPVIKSRIHRLRAKPSIRLQWNFIAGFWPAIKTIREVIRENEIEVVVVGGLVNPHAAIAARLERVPVVWQILDTRTPGPLVRLLMPVVKRLADSILVTGIAVARAHPGAEDFGDRLFTFFPPVDIETFRRDQSARESARAELGIGAGDVVVGNVSNVNPQKGQLTFVRAAGKVHEVYPEARFLILGAKYPEHAAYVRDLESAAVQAGLEVGTNLIFHDPGAEVVHYANALDIFWLTSEPRSEGIPTVIEEAMALGLPVVTTDVGSVRDAVVENQTGLVVPARDPNAIAEASLRIMRDPELQVAFGTAARARAVELFSSQVCADVHVKAFEAAIRHSESRD